MRWLRYLNLHFFLCRPLTTTAGSNEQKSIKESYQMSPTRSGDGKTEVQKVIASNIDEGAWYVCNKVWELLEKPIVDDELPLKERLADIQVEEND